MASDFIVNVSETNFEQEVLSYSESIPVIVDFWADWCIPCKVLSPLLERLVVESAGAFRLAKLDVDANPNLAQRYKVRTIPVIKAFRNGQVASEFTGAMPEPRLREFIKSLAPTPSDLLLEKASSLAKLHQWASAENTYRKFLETSPDHPAGILGLAKCLLALGEAKEALMLLRNFPASHEFATAELLLPLANGMANLQNNAYDVDDPMLAAYRNSLRLASRGNIPAALDGLLDILRQNKRYLGGELRQVVVGLLEILGEEDPQTRQYRSELASILF